MSGQEDQPKCPVSPESRTKWSLLLWASNNKPDDKPVVPPVVADDQPKCPVDHNTRADWLKKVSVTTTTTTEAVEINPGESCTSDKLGSTSSTTNVNLPTDREISSIPRTSSNSNWIYPSEKQFFDAMTRKKWNPNADDMKAVVPIHNVVNERTWNHILNWEHANREEAEQKCGGIKLTSFKGNPNKLTPRAWFRTNVLGMEKPFDRHDWVVDRCGTEIEYVIDFYSGNETNPNVFLDVRPKLNSLEGIKLRLGRALGWN